TRRSRGCCARSAVSTARPARARSTSSAPTSASTPPPATSSTASSPSSATTSRGGSPSGSARPSGGPADRARGTGTGLSVDLGRVVRLVRRWAPHAVRLPPRPAERRLDGRLPPAPLAALRRLRRHPGARGLGAEVAAPPRDGGRLHDPDPLPRPAPLRAAGLLGRTTLTSRNAAFLALLVTLALLATFDPWYRAVVQPRPWLGYVFFVVSIFASLNVALPLVGVPPFPSLIAS